MKESTLNFAQARKKASGSTKSAPDGYPITDREHTFQVQYHAPDGEYYDVAVKSVIMDDEERAFRGRAAATVAGVPWEQLPHPDRNRIYMQATVTTQVRDMPKWMFDSNTGKGWLMEDELLCAQIYNICSMHEARYLRRYDASGSGDKEWTPVVIVSSFYTDSSSVEG